MVAALAIGCQPSGRGASSAEDSKPLPIPAAQISSVGRAQRLGQLLFAHDSIGARATDAVYRKFHTIDSRVHGWLTFKSGDDWTVPFLANDNGATKILYRVNFRGFLDATPQVDVLDNAEPLDERTSRMFAARETASRQDVQRCSRTYNTVVLPATEAGQQGWLVYLLAATTEPGAIVSGGHHRFVISSDGGTIIDHFQFTKACLTMPAPKVKKGERVSGTMVTHLTSETPTEMHVFLSLLHHLPIYVGVVEPRALWAVNGSRVELIATKDEPTEQ
ncbi:MAG TPA: hypothetical protein VIV60_27465 [Polyangiaceae bacterium]